MASEKELVAPGSLPQNGNSEMHVRGEGISRMDQETTEPDRTIAQEVPQGRNLTTQSTCERGFMFSS